MALSANEQFFDAMVRHQIALTRLSGSIRNDVFGLLNETEKDLVQQILRRVKDGGFTPNNVRRLQGLEVVIRKLRGEAWKQVAGVWRTEFSQLAIANPAFVANAAATVLPITVNFSLPAPELLRSLVVARPFEGKILSGWAKGIAQTDISRIMDQIKIGMVQGESSQAIARRVVGTRLSGGKNGVTEISRRGAESITRTAVNHYSNQANREFFELNKDIFKQEVYVATLDDVTTLICASLDGERFPVGEGPIPPLHFRCRSLRVAVIDDEIVGTRFAKPVAQRGLLRDFAKQRGIAPVSRRSALPRGTKGQFDSFAREQTRKAIGKVPAKVNYSQWLGRQSTQFQNDVLGVTRARLFRDGNLPLKKFVNRAGDDIPLRDLARVQRQAFLDAGLDPDNF